MDAEKLILTKQFHELTASELKLVSVYASNQDEFNEMKQFFISTQSAIETDKIVASKELNTNILNHLNSTVQNHQPWYNTLFVFLFPRDRSFYQYPAFQLAIASVLVFGVFNLFNTDLKDSNLAFNETSQKEITSPEPANLEKKEGLLNDAEEQTVAEIEKEANNSGYINADNKSKIEAPLPPIVEKLYLNDESISYFEESEMADEVYDQVDLVEAELEEDIMIKEEKSDKAADKTNQSFSDTNKEISVVTTGASSDTRVNRKDRNMKDYKKVETEKTNVEQTTVSSPTTAVSVNEVVMSDDEVLQSDKEKSIVISTINTTELNQLFFVVK